MTTLIFTRQFQLKSLSVKAMMKNTIKLNATANAREEYERFER